MTPVNEAEPIPVPKMELPKLDKWILCWLDGDCWDGAVFNTQESMEREAQNVDGPIRKFRCRESVAEGGGLTSSRTWAYRITDPPCKHGGRDCPKSECVDCVMEVIEAIQQEAFRAGRSQPIDADRRYFVRSRTFCVQPTPNADRKEPPKWHDPSCPKFRHRDGDLKVGPCTCEFDKPKFQAQGEEQCQHEFIGKPSACSKCGKWKCEVLEEHGGTATKPPPASDEDSTEVIYWKLRKELFGDEEPAKWDRYKVRDVIDNCVAHGKSIGRAEVLEKEGVDALIDEFCDSREYASPTVRDSRKVLLRDFVEQLKRGGE